MYYFTRLSHIVDGFILPAGMRVWVVCTHTRTRLPDGYMMLPIYVSAGRNIISYPSPYRIKPVGYSGFGYPLPSLTLWARGRNGNALQLKWIARFPKNLTVPWQVGPHAVGVMCEWSAGRSVSHQPHMQPVAVPKGYHIYRERYVHVHVVLAKTNNKEHIAWKRMSQIN
jgi:hypothetical protein